jgi:hypothetical protein
MDSSVSTSALRDQIDAAATEAQRVLLAAAMSGGGASRMAPVSPWLARRLAQIHFDFDNNRLRRCRHVKGAPMPVIAVAWRPGRLWCLPCASNEMARVQGTVLDRTCDICGNVVDVIYPDLVADGPLIFTYGSCRSCLPVARGIAA